MTNSQSISKLDPYVGPLSTPVKVESPATPQPKARALRMKALVLLAGTVRHDRFSASLGRSRLDLPIAPDVTILNRWQEQAAAAAESDLAEDFAIRVIVDQRSPAPTSEKKDLFEATKFERDRHEFRGTAGILHDMAKDYEDDDWLFVASASHVLIEPLPVILRRMLAIAGDVKLLAHVDGTRCGLMLIRCGVLRQIEPIGYVDMKEQALPQISSRHDVRVINLHRHSGIPVTNLAEYVRALRYCHTSPSQNAQGIDPLAENWQSTFHLAETSAHIDPTACAHDTVVLNGGRIESGAIVVRSLVCSGATVPAGATVIDQVVTAVATGHGHR